VWSLTANYGSFHVLSSENITLSFYPGTKTLCVQGTMEKEVKAKIAWLLRRETGNFGSDPDNQASFNKQDGAAVEKDHDLEGGGEESDGNLEERENRLNDTAYEGSSSCNRNSQILAELGQKMSAIEAGFETNTKFRLQEIDPSRVLKF